MIEVKLRDAEGHLGELIEEAAAGKEVVITSASGSAVRLVALLKQRGEPPTSSKVVGHALDRFIGTWSEEQAAELLQAVEVFEQVDESFWK